MFAMISSLMEKQCRAASAGSKPQLGLVGHVGIGHAHGHSGIVQDDSVGFTCIIAILRSVFPLICALPRYKPTRSLGALF